MAVYRSAAKINLFLAVAGVRDDGYHELVSVMQSVSLWDRLEITFHHPRFSLDCGGAELGPVEDNIVTKMWRLLKARFDLDGEIAVAIDKRIPVGAGLGGGSGNGAALLRAVIDEYDLDLDDDEIAKIAAAVGADVAFCFYGGTMLARGIGERLTPLPSLPPCDILLFNGGFHVSTPEIFAAYDARPPQTGGIPVERLLTALKERNGGEIRAALRNDLTGAALDRYPSLRQLTATLTAASVPHLMSGSGPTVFAFVPKERAAALLKAEPSLRRTKVIPVQPIEQGVFC